MKNFLIIIFNVFFTTASFSQLNKNSFSFSSAGDLNTPSVAFSQHIELIKDSVKPISTIPYFRNENKSFGRKFLRAELLVHGAELTGLGILLLLPENVTRWYDGYLDRAKHNFKKAWTTPPVIDKDNWFINYVTHPLSGSYYYNAMRSQGATKLQGFLFTALQSAMWEYGLEAFAEQPSIQDLIVTPVFGYLTGEAIHRLTQKMGRNGFNLREKIFIFLFNPMYVINNGYKIKYKISYAFNN